MLIIMAENVSKEPKEEKMSTELTIINQPSTEIAQGGGLGIDFSSSIFQLRPATLSINQLNTQTEGAIKGKLRFSDTGDQYDELFCTLLAMPTEKRAYYLGKPGEMNRSPENLMCFCSTVTRNAYKQETSSPDSASKVAQAVRCQGCQRASWDKYRQTKQKEDIPQCDLYYHVYLIDTKYKMPMQMYIRSKSKQPFEQGMEKLARRFMMMKSQGKNPNVFDIGFTLRSKKTGEGKFVYYVPDLSDFREITAEEKAEFGELYQTFIASRSRATNTVLEDEDVVSVSSETINAQVTGDIGEVVNGEIVI